MQYSHFTSTDAGELLARVDAAASRFVALAASVEPSLRLPRSTWTARDVVGHLLTVVRRYTRRDPRRPDGLSDSPRAVDAQNAAELAALGDAPSGELLGALRAELAVFAQRYTPDFDLSARFPFHGGISVDGAAGLGNLVAEFLVHGRDVALAAGRTWDIEERDAVLVLNGVVQILPAYARRSATGSLRVRLDVPGATPWLLDVAGGRLESHAWSAGEAVDAVVRVPAPTLFLGLYTRIGTAASLRAGWRVVGGRRPWRIVRLRALLEKP